jgi:hypothetical protein
MKIAALPTYFWVIALLSFCCLPAFAQRTVSGTLIDAVSHEPLPFAVIKSSGATVAVLTDLNGKFDAIFPDSILLLTAQYLGYESQEIVLKPGTNKGLIIQLKIKEGMLEETVVNPPYEKIKAIVNKTISNRSLHRPDNYEWYRCTIYQKTIVDIIVPDSVKQDTAQSLFGKFLDGKHILLSETYSRRTYQKPQKLQDEVLATKVSGWKKAPFVTLITNVLPFDVYSDFIKLNGKDYANPISRGWASRYVFDLVDELIQGKDTLYILSFRPKQKTQAADLMQGQVYIHSAQYAIAYFLGKNTDNVLKRTVNVEQKYQQVEGRWFPQQLNYEMVWNNYLKTDKGIPFGLYSKGTSEIGAPQWETQKDFRFDKAKTILLAKGADEMPDTVWKAFRHDTLSTKEATTYRFMDSVYQEIGLDKMMPFMEKFSAGKMPVSIIDIDLKRLLSYNGYEKTRLGMGIQTNEKVLKYASLGGWAGYGFGDKEWKYGGFAEFYLDRYKDKIIKIGYDKDLLDPGRIQLHKDIDRGYLQMWMMKRADRIEGLYIKANARMGYWNIGLDGRLQEITPQYDYGFRYGKELLNQFRARELSLSLRYAFGEKRALVFDRYENTGTKYPVAYLKLTCGQIEGGTSYSNSYFQAIGVIKWSKHFNRIGKETILLMAGVSESESPLPLSKLFAGRGFLNKSYPIYAFGGFATMYPYDYYSDRFVSLFWKHDFDWRLFNAGGWIKPYISLSHNVLYGNMEHTTDHEMVSFSVPNKGYHESGIMLNDLIKYKYINLAYLNFNAGYFYHWTGESDLKKNGSFVLGATLKF